MKSPSRGNYRLGGLYSLVTAVLVATQEPFTKNLAKLTVLFIFGLCRLTLYYVGLSSAHPIITATIFNLSPFWAALVAMMISRKPIPVSPCVFFGCFIVAFVGAMTVAWSQLDNTNGRLVTDIIESMLHSRWSYAIPIPIFFALSGNLVGKWFSEFDQSAAIAANFVVSSIILLPTILLIPSSSGIVCRRTHTGCHSIIAIRNFGCCGGWTCLLSGSVDNHG